MFNTERILEIRVIIDGGQPNVKEMFVYVDNLKGQFKMHRDDSRF